ncbi:hypothetical protein NQ315_000122 [Exocentrus adspersus]|uniref:Uncharacterized protein n=1 Tax=Exocentrus adspersus TaxID=1586481 RepID=A0AAV8VTI7_9CUCU|nr:hypothetical protein NQ315_000122 [Exocentrus adspersus]
MRAVGRKNRGHSAVAFKAEKEVSICAMTVIEAELRLRFKRNYSTRDRRNYPRGTVEAGRACVPSRPLFATVFKIELIAILMVTHREDVKNRAEGKILIGFDSQAAFIVISSPRTRSILIQQCRRCPGILNQAKRAMIHRNPREREAVQLARLRSEEPYQGHEPILGISKGNINEANSSN